MQVKIDTIKEKLGIKGDDLLTRPIGSEFYSMLVGVLKTTKKEPIIELDFSGIKTIDFSFSDECIARLFEEEILKEHFGNCVCLIRNLISISAIENLHVSFDYDRDVCCFIVNELSSEHTTEERLGHRKGIIDSQHFYILVGSLEDKLYETLEFIIKQHETTARKVADFFDLNINTASTRLLKLYQKHLIHRKEEVSSEGRQYMYYSPF